MTVLNTANSVRVGSNAASAAYLGATKVWPSLTVIDSFTDVSGTPLTSHVANNGGTWISAISGAALLISLEGRVRKSGTVAVNLAYHSVAHATDIKVEFDLLIKTTITTVSNALGILLRQPGTAADTGYLFDYVASTVGPVRMFRLLRMSGGVTAETVGTYEIATPADGTTFRIRAEVRNGFQQLSVDGVPRITGASAALNGTGRIAIRASGAVATTNAAGTHLDNLTIVN